MAEEPLDWKPRSPGGWCGLAAGLLLLLLALWVELPMWLVEAGFRSVAAGGGEYMLALFVGLPISLVATGVLAVTVARPGWRSRLARYALYVSLLPLGGFLVLFLTDLR